MNIVKIKQYMNIFTMVSFEIHCAIGFFVRLSMILYGVVQDEVSEVKYTDIDYKVFTDAAKHVINGNSPYDRYTYRYSPLLAYILVPNIILHQTWGKVLFSFCDIIICVFIRKLLKVDKVNERTVLWCVYFWLYNPMTVIISTRGNADSLSSLLVLGTLLMMKKRNYLWAGILHGVSVHFRIYPIAFSVCMYLSITNSGLIKNRVTLKHFTKVIMPNFNRMKLVIGCVFTLILITGVFYLLYGYTFLYESLLYHLYRHDIRHNFSVYFYLQYLSALNISTIQKILTILPQFVLVLVISFAYGNIKNIYFCHFLLAFIMVTYNTVLTCQYFIWFLCLMPLVIPKLKTSLKESMFLIVLWGIGQLAWLLPAYLLEFKNQPTFIHIWFQGLVFFCINIFVIARMIVNYNKQAKHD